MPKRKLKRSGRQLDPASLTGTSTCARHIQNVDRDDVVVEHRIRSRLLPSEQTRVEGSRDHNSDASLTAVVKQWLGSLIDESPAPGDHDHVHVRLRHETAKGLD